MSEKTCKNCDYWDEGVCQAPQSSIRQTKDPRVWGLPILTACESDGFGVYADASDDTGLHAELVTGPDFGCTKFSRAN